MPVGPSRTRKPRSKKAANKRGKSQSGVDLRKILRPVIADAPDLRDLPYRPALISVADRYPSTVPTDLAIWQHPYTILDQEDEGACTGFGLAAVINDLYRRKNVGQRVSPWMLYDMAKRYDEWNGNRYEGSSLRGALRGWANAGACDEDLFKKGARLTLKAARDARSTRIGAYYRLERDLNQFQVALNEAGVIYVSAYTHDGWEISGKSIIKYKGPSDTDGHAFAIVGYNADGFIVQNSWGESWGQRGLGIWTYEDWSVNLLDAWVVRLGAQTPNAFGLRPSDLGSETLEEGAVESRSVKRLEIAGHFVHVDDGKFAENDRYWSKLDDVKITADHVASSPDYQHLLFYAHGGLNSPKASASRILAMKDGFKRNGVYPFHFMYDTGVGEEIKDIVSSKLPFMKMRAGGLTDWTDRAIEKATRKAGTLLWDEMKKDARVAFAARGAATQTVDAFLDTLAKPSSVKLGIHLVGHSTGGILLAHLLERLAASGRNIDIESVSLLAPANTIAQYAEIYRPRLAANAKVAIKNLDLYVLSKKKEKDDNVAKVYRKSLLYLVSNAFEREHEKPILGMKKFHDGLPASNRLRVLVAKDGSRDSLSESHGGFDNDPVTMNTVLQRILGRASRKPFNKRELKY